MRCFYVDEGDSQQIERISSLKCLAQQGIEVFPRFNFGVVLFGLTPFYYRTTKDAKITQLALCPSSISQLIICHNI